MHRPDKCPMRLQNNRFCSSSWRSMCARAMKATSWCEHSSPIQWVKILQVELLYRASDNELNSFLFARHFMGSIRGRIISICNIEHTRPVHSLCSLSEQMERISIAIHRMTFNRACVSAKSRNSTWYFSSIIISLSLIDKNISTQSNTHSNNSHTH